jgi:hypothetical protein
MLTLFRNKANNIQDIHQCCPVFIDCFNKHSNSGPRLKFRSELIGESANNPKEILLLTLHFQSILKQQSDRRLSAKLVKTSANRGCCVVSITDPDGRILGFLDRTVRSRTKAKEVFLCYQY